MSTASAGQRSVNDNQYLAIEFAITQSVVGIVGKGQDGILGHQIGTGTLCEERGKRFILTAEHVVSQCSAEDLFFFTPAESVGRQEFGQPLDIKLDEMAVRKSLPITCIHADSNLDVAILELPPEFRGESYWTFRRILPTPPDLEVGDHTVAIGHPSQLAQPIDRNGLLMVFKKVESLKVTDLGTTSIEGFDPQKHFLTDFPSLKRFHPGGFSGSGVWANYETKRDVWVAYPAFVGMIVSYFNRREMLKAVRASAIVDFIKGSLPALAANE
jgi:hypothetical protein